MNHRAPVSLATFLLLFLVRFVGADTPPPGPNFPPPLFPKGTWDLSLSGGYSTEFYPYDHIKLELATLGVDYYFRDNVSIGLQVPGYALQEQPRDGAAAGLNLGFRDHFFQRGKFSLYADLIGGLFQGSHEIPDGGTYFNFTIQGGIGATYRLADHLHLFGGVRIFHLSNAAIEGINRNPDLNSVHAYLGALFTF